MAGTFFELGPPNFVRSHNFYICIAGKILKVIASVVLNLEKSMCAVPSICIRSPWLDLLSVAAETEWAKPQWNMCIGQAISRIFDRNIVLGGRSRTTFTSFRPYLTTFSVVDST